MGYNKFRWYTKGKPRVKAKSNKLIDRIEAGEFDVSYYYEESHQYLPAFDIDRRKNEDEWNARRMDRVRYLKLQEEADAQERKILRDFRKALRKNFRIDVWDDMLKQPPMTPIEVYRWYQSIKAAKDAI